MSEIVSASLENLRRIVEDQQTARFRWPDDTGRGVLIDAWTASAILKVHSAVNAANREKIERMIGAGRSKFFRVAEFSLARVAA